MNIERLNRLADVLDAVETLNGATFDIGVMCENAEDNIEVAENKCGTTGCIAAWACLMFGENGKGITGAYAAHLLGLTGVQEWQLFYPFDFSSPDSLFRGLNYETITRHSAATAIRRMVARDAKE
jgi:hypothetical protein